MGLDLAGHGSRTAAETRRMPDALRHRRSVDFFRGFGAMGLQHMIESGLGIIFVAIFFDDLEGIDGTNIQAGAHPVTEYLFDEDSFLVFIQDQRALRASFGAKSAPVAFFPVNFNDFTFHGSLF